MTHNDIYTKFMIEYDKANVTSSYPSLTKYEIATILDKAYLAIIGEKVTGNNPRQATFESDSKSIEDIRPLITETKVTLKRANGYITNRYYYKLPEESLYLVSSQINLRYGKKRSNQPMDKPNNRVWPISLVSHETAQKFFATPYNMPWIKQPVCYIEGDTVYVLVDSMWKDLYNMSFRGSTSVQYIQNPKKFALIKDNKRIADFGDTVFELSDSMAEELINLALVMSLENIESTRLQAKVQTRTLEA